MGNETTRDVWIPNDPRAKTAIAWTHRTNNPAVGCWPVDPSCGPCWASQLVGTRMAVNPNLPRYRHLATVRENGLGRWSGKVEFFPERLAEPIGWRTPVRIFWFDLSDLFYELIPFEFIAAVFGFAALAHQHQHQFLTRRPQRALEFFAWLRAKVEPRGEAYPTAISLYCICQAMGLHVDGQGAASARTRKAAQRVYERTLFTLPTWPLANVHLGISASDQPLFDARWSLLRQCDAAVRWVSYEPAYGPVDFTQALADGLDWVVCGGESKDVHPSPFEERWALDARGACGDAGKAFFMKQYGTWLARHQGLKQRKGEDPGEWMAALRVREFPVALPLKTAPGQLELGGA